MVAVDLEHFRRGDVVVLFLIFMVQSEICLKKKKLSKEARGHAEQSPSYSNYVTSDRVITL